MTRRTWDTPLAVTKPVFIAVAGLVTLGVVAVLGGAAVRAHRDPAFRPDWAVWAPVSVGIGLGVVGLACLAMLAQRLPPRPIAPAGPFPRPIADGTERALLRGEALTPSQAASLNDLVEGQGDRLQLWALAAGPLYLVGGGVGLVFGHDSSFSATYLLLGVLWCAAGGLQLRRRRRLLDRAAELGVVHPAAPRSTVTTPSGGL